MPTTTSIKELIPVHDYRKRFDIKESSFIEKAEKHSFAIYMQPSVQLGPQKLKILVDLLVLSKQLILDFIGLSKWPSSSGSEEQDQEIQPLNFAIYSGDEAICDSIGRRCIHDSQTNVAIKLISSSNLYSADLLLENRIPLRFFLCWQLSSFLFSDSSSSPNDGDLSRNDHSSTTILSAHDDKDDNDNDIVQPKSNDYTMDQDSISVKNTDMEKNDDGPDVGKNDDSKKYCDDESDSGNSPFNHSDNIAFIQPQSPSDWWLVAGLSGWIAAQTGIVAGFGRNEYKCWIGDCVSLVRQWSDSMLNNSRGEMALSTDWVTQFNQLSRSDNVTDSLGSQSSPRKPNDIFDSQGYVYPPSTYEQFLQHKPLRLKSLLIIHMLEKSLGRSLLQKVLNNLMLSGISGELGQGVSTDRFFRLVKKLSGKHQQLDYFCRQWVFRPGLPRVRAWQHFNRKKNLIELRIQQLDRLNDDTASPKGIQSFSDPSQTLPLYNGNLTIRVHEPEGTFDHVVRLDDKLHLFELNYHTKYRRLRQQKKNLLMIGGVGVALQQQNQNSPRGGNNNAQLSSKVSPPTSSSASSSNADLSAPMVPNGNAAQGSDQLSSIVESMAPPPGTEFDDALNQYDPELNSELKKAKLAVSDDITLNNLEQQENEQQQLQQQHPVNWIRIDPDVETLVQVHLEQSDYQFRQQLMKDRDVISQIEAIEQLTRSAASFVHKRCQANKRKRSGVADDNEELEKLESESKDQSKSAACLLASLVDVRSFYRVRMLAALGLARAFSHSCLDWVGIRYLTLCFRKKFCLPPSAGSPASVLVPRRNDFRAVSEYFVQKSLAHSLALVRDDLGNPIEQAQKFLVSLLRLNDNTANQFSDCWYLELVVRAVGVCFLNDQNLNDPTFTGNELLFPLRKIISGEDPNFESAGLNQQKLSMLEDIVSILDRRYGSSDFSQDWSRLKFIWMPSFLSDPLSFAADKPEWSAYREFGYSLLTAVNQANGIQDIGSLSYNSAVFSEALEEIDRYLFLETQVPSHQNMVAVSCLQVLFAWRMAQLLPPTHMSVKPFLVFSRRGNFLSVRKICFEALVWLGWFEERTREYLLYVLSNDEESIEIKVFIAERFYRLIRAMVNFYNVHRKLKSKQKKRKKEKSKSISSLNENGLHVEVEDFAAGIPEVKKVDTGLSQEREENPKKASGYSLVKRFLFNWSNFREFLEANDPKSYSAQNLCESTKPSDIEIINVGEDAKYRSPDTIYLIPDHTKAIQLQEILASIHSLLPKIKPPKKLSIKSQEIPTKRESQLDLDRPKFKIKLTLSQQDSSNNPSSQDTL